MNGEGMRVPQFFPNKPGRLFITKSYFSQADYIEIIYKGQGSEWAHIDVSGPC